MSLAARQRRVLLILGLLLVLFAGACSSGPQSVQPSLRAGLRSFLNPKMGLQGVALRPGCYLNAKGHASAGSP